MHDVVCWVLLGATVLYFIRIDRELRALRTELIWFREQLRPWGFITPKDNK